MARDSERRDTQPLPSQETPAEHAFGSTGRFDNYETISAWTAGAGLLVIGISPFFLWINLGAGGVVGLAGDGKIVLALSVLGAAAYAGAMVTRKLLTPAVLCIQAWGTISVFWMGALIWKVGSILDAPDVRDNPFAGMLSTMLVRPGAGLYLGLIGGITVAAALGFLAVRLLLAGRNLKPFYASQAVSSVLGIMLALLVVPDRPSTWAGTTPKSPFEINLSDDGPADREREPEEARQAVMKTAYISKHLELYDVTAQYMDSFLEGKVPGVLFKIRNKRDKSLNRVEVTI